MTSAAVEAYLAGLPLERRATVEAVRKVILENLPDGYREGISSGMLGYMIPLEAFPNTYNKQPLIYIALAAQKNYYSLYMIAAYMDPDELTALREGFTQTGRKLDMGKSCVRFKRLEDLPLDVIGASVARTPPAKYIAQYEFNRTKVG